MSNPRNNRLKKQFYLYTYANNPGPYAIACDLLNGVDVILVEPRLFDSLKPQLQLFRGRYSDSSDPKMVNKINWMIQYIDEYPERQRINQRLQLKESNKRNKPPPYNDDELQQEVDSILSGNQIKNYTPAQRNQILTEFKQVRSNLASENKIEEAAKYDSCIRAIIQKSECEQAFKENKERANELQRQIDDAKKELEELKLRWKAVETRFQSRNKEEIKKYEEEQQKEYQLEVENCKKNPPKTIARHSTEALYLKRRAEVLSAAKKIDEANECLKQAEKCEAEEEASFNRQWEAANRVRLSQLAEKQRQAMEIRKANLARDGKRMAEAKESEIAAAEHRVHTLETMLARAESDFAPMTMMASPQQPQSPSKLPPLSLGGLSNKYDGPQTFRQRALLNMKIYTRRPPVSARHHSMRI